MGMTEHWGSGQVAPFCWRGPVHGVVGIPHVLVVQGDLGFCVTCKEWGIAAMDLLGESPCSVALRDWHGQCPRLRHNALERAVAASGELGPLAEAYTKYLEVNRLT